jgi:Uncharacterised nucleotidyltransferase
MQLATEERSFSAERMLELLLSSAADRPAHFKHLCSEVENWDEILHSALHHGVESYLHRCLIDAGILLPPGVKERTERWLAVRDVWQTHAQATLQEALRVLDAARVKAVCLKGPVLAERLYPDPRIRPSADLDVLVARADLDRATNALSAIGYRPAKDSQERFLRRYHYHTMLSRSCPPVIELHFFLSGGFGVMIPAEEFLSRACVYRTSQGTAANILAPEDELLYLSIHAAGHRFVRLSWLCDIQLLLHRHPNLDWKTVAARARRLGVLAAFLFACDTLRRRLRVEIPHIKDTRIQRIRSRMANFLLAFTAKQPDPSRRSLVGKMAFTALLCDRPKAAMGFLQRQMLLITRRRARRLFPSLAPEEWSY